jgi:hypothetical protein
VLRAEHEKCKRGFGSTLNGFCACAAVHNFLHQLWGYSASIIERHQMRMAARRKGMALFDGPGDLDMHLHRVHHANQFRSAECMARAHEMSSMQKQ